MKAQVRGGTPLAHRTPLWERRENDLGPNMRDNGDDVLTLSVSDAWSLPESALADGVAKPVRERRDRDGP